MSGSFMVQPVERDRLFSDEELVKGMNFCTTHEHMPYWAGKCFNFRFGIGTGLRVSEIVPLRVPEDCGSDGIVQIRRSKTGRKRNVKVTPELRPYYLARIQKLQGQKLFPGLTSTKTLQRWLDELMEAAGVSKAPGRNMHGLRHSYATWEMASRRLDWVELALQLGHANPSITMQVYAHAISEFMYETTDRTPKFWEAAMPQKHLRVVTRDCA